MAKTVLVTGAAGFIGSHVVEALCRRGDRVLGLDSFDGYYDPAVKHRNVAEVRAGLPAAAAFELTTGDVRDRDLVRALLGRGGVDAVVHLAALAGVRASIGHAARYFDVNVTGTIHLLDACVEHHVPQFVFASTSSVYGNTTRLPFVEDDACDRPLAPYPASKRACELLGYSHHNLHGLSFTALRFFTVYGPRNRPDMMAYKLLESVTRGEPVEVYEGGQLKRDWTYVADIAQGVLEAVDRPLGYELINLGRGEPVLLADFVRVVEELGGRRAVTRDARMPAADVRQNFADVS
ncbi:MAG: SDR family NAD(P)-dependent oxidoreductase, partial [Polyangiales bacterium]